MKNDDHLHSQVADYFKKRIGKSWKTMMVLVSLIALILLGISALFPGSIKIYSKCEEAEEISEMSFVGIVSKKKNPKAQHGLHFLVIESSGKREDVLVLDGDRFLHKESRKSFFWELISVGDSVRKESGTFEVSYKKNGQPWKMRELGFDLCN